jgi:hypothetical protein
MQNVDTVQKPSDSNQKVQLEKSYTWKIVIAGNKPSDVNEVMQVYSIIGVSIFTYH